MLLHNLSFSSTSSRSVLSTGQSNRINYEATHLYSRRSKLKVTSTFASIGVGTDAIAEIAQNKVLIAAAASCALGQLVKPFASSILYRSDFDLKAVFQSGGFPSSHSSAAVATAVSLGLERGLSDSIFGLAVVYAGLIMYDAQGVRREVGVHARTLNKVFTRHQPYTHSPSNANTFRPELRKETLLMTTEKKVSTSCLTDDTEEGLESSALISGSLKENIGHTEIEVVAGALLGLIGSLAIHSL